MAATGRSNSGAFVAVGFGVVLFLTLANIWLGLISLILLGSFAFFVLFPRTCGLCGMSLRKGQHRWIIDGMRMRVCMHCNGTLEKRQSRHPEDHNIRKL
jgi:hypothetical protein